MRVVPVLCPCDLGTSDQGKYVESGERGAPDVILDMLEGEGVRMARPIPVTIEQPTDDDSKDSPFKFDVAIARALKAIAEVVEQVNSDSNFPLVLGGDHTTLMGHVLGHSRRHEKGIGLAVISAHSGLLSPGVPVFDDKKRLRSEAEATETGDAHRMILSGALRLIPETFEVGKVMAESAVQAAQTSIVGVRAPDTAQIKANEKASKIEMWRMERLEFDGESAYRSMLNRHLSAGPIMMSIDVGGLDPDLMSAVRNPLNDGLDWTFLKKTLDQCLPHVDRLLGLDICELDPSKDAAHHGAILRFAETLGPFLRKLTR